MEILAAKQLKKYYQMGDTVVKALDGIDLSIQKGEFAAVVGKSGSGKSTLLHMLGGLDYPTGGEVRVDGRDISRMEFPIRERMNSQFSGAGKSDSYFRTITCFRL